MSKAVHTYIDKMAMKSYCDENSSSIRQIENSFDTSEKGKQIRIHENYPHICAEIVKKTKIFQARFKALQNRYMKKEINARNCYQDCHFSWERKINRASICCQFSLPLNWQRIAYIVYQTISGSFRRFPFRRFPPTQILCPAIGLVLVFF